MGYSPSNKGDRERIAKKKHKGRCDAMGIGLENSYALKSDAKPCSCWVCKGEKYNRRTEPKLKVMTIEEIDAIRIHAYDFVI